MNQSDVANNLNIILFLCNWGPHVAYQSLQDAATRIDPGIQMVRIPCTGRISKALLFKPFEMGADGVALVGCEAGSCRYGHGTDTAEKNIHDTRSILELLGLGKERMRHATFTPDDTETLFQFLQQFCDDIRRLGSSPVEAKHTPGPISISADEISTIVATHDIYACQDCGKCTSACPLALAGKPFSPRGLANSVIAGNLGVPDVQNDVWSCLTCGICYDRCPSAVNFPAFIRDLRYILKQGIIKAPDSHGGFFQSLMRTMASPSLQVRHWEWLPSNIKLDHNSRTLFFGGCAPYFDRFFHKHLQVKTSDILVDSLRLLNFFDIFPAVMPEERCCGHDLLWAGDRDSFLRLGKLNSDRIHAMGIEEVITACPECYRTLVHDYPEHGIDTNVKVTHLYEILEKEIAKGAVGFDELNQTITFQDPCRLSRFEGRGDLPRRLIKRLGSCTFSEMQNRESGAICCGNSAWIGCDSFSKALQVKRLNQAHDCGSDLLVTACPKCLIHLTCAMEDPFRGDKLEIEIKDLTSVMASTIRWE